MATPLEGIQLISSFKTISDCIESFLPACDKHKIEYVLPASIPEYDHLYPDTVFDPWEEMMYEDPRDPILCTSCLAYYNLEGTMQCNCEN